MWKQAYDLVRLLCQYTCHHPGILGNMEAVAKVRPVVEDETSRDGMSRLANLRLASSACPTQ